MPELPEIEVTRRTVHQRLLGLRVAEVQLKRSGKTSMHGAELLPSLVARRLVDTGRRGKMLVLYFESDLALLVHLMLIGRVALYQGGPDSFEPRLRLRFEGEQNLEVRFVAARSLALGPSGLVDAYPSVARQGSDALAITLDGFIGALRRSRGAIKGVFMDQSLLAGVGNAYADEILYDAGVHPLAPVASLSEGEEQKLHAAIAPVLRRAIDLGAAEEYVRFLGPAEGLTRKADLMRVHGREAQPCPACGASIEKVELGGRGTYYCPRCQPR